MRAKCGIQSRERQRLWAYQLTKESSMFVGRKKSCGCIVTMCNDMQTTSVTLKAWVHHCWAHGLRVAYKLDATVQDCPHDANQDSYGGGPAEKNVPRGDGWPCQLGCTGSHRPTGISYHFARQPLDINADNRQLRVGKKIRSWFWEFSCLNPEP